MHDFWMTVYVMLPSTKPIQHNVFHLSLTLLSEHDSKLKYCIIHTYTHTHKHIRTFMSLDVGSLHQIHVSDSQLISKIKDLRLILNKQKNAQIRLHLKIDAIR